MTKESTWVRCTRHGTYICHDGFEVEKLGGTPLKINLSALKKYADHPHFQWPGQMVVDLAESPVPFKPYPVSESTNQTQTPPPPSFGSLVSIKHTYVNQRNNSYKPGASCGPSSMVMVANAYGINVPSSPDPSSWVFKRLEQAYGQRKDMPGTVACMKALMEKDWGFKDEVRWSLTPTQYEQHIRDGGVCVLHTKAGSMTGSGHIIALFGYDKTLTLPSVVASDPYGEAFRGTLRFTPGKGHYIRYSYNWMLSSRNLLAVHMLSHPTRSVQYN